MTILRTCAALAIALSTSIGAAHAAMISQLLGEPVRDEGGEGAGKISDLIVDVRAGRVLYLLVDAGERFYSLPVRALGEDRRIDMREAGELARPDAEEAARFRRASELMGEAVQHPHPGGKRTIGIIHDIEFDPGSGRIERVVLKTGESEFGVGAGVLAHGRFPPLTQEQRTYPDREELGERGYLRREPSAERRRLHDPEWRTP